MTIHTHIQVQPRTPDIADPYATVPLELRQRSQWLVWKHHKGKKPPCNPITALPTDQADKSIWLTFDQAVSIAQADQRFAGIGYLFTPDDQLVGIDLDDCLTDGLLDSRAKRIVSVLSSYTEISPSGAGVKTFVRAPLESNPVALVPGVEIYTRNRFFTVTGRQFPGTPDQINRVSDELLTAIIEKYTAETAQNELGRTATQKIASISTNSQQNTTGRIIDNPILIYATDVDPRRVLDRNGGKPDGKKLYHCPCPKLCHSGKSGSLLMKQSPKYGIVVTGLNPGCAFFGNCFSSFDVMKILECDGDLNRAIAKARDELSIPIQRDYEPLVFKPVAPAPAEARIVTDPASVLVDVTQRMAADLTMKKSARAVLTALLGSARNGYVSLTVTQLVNLTGLSESSVQRATRELHGRYIAKHQDASDIGGNVANVYQFIATESSFDTPLLKKHQKAEIDTPLLNHESKGGGIKENRSKSEIQSESQNLQKSNRVEREESESVGEQSHNEDIDELNPPPPLLSQCI